LNSKLILLVGFIVSILYVLGVSYFYTPSIDSSKTLEVESAKFLYVKDNRDIDIVSKLSYTDKESSLVLTLKNLCKEYSCKKEVSFKKNINSPSWLELTEKLINFSLEKELNFSSLVISDNTLEINFTLKTKDDLMQLSSIHDKYKDDFLIVDKSSIVKFYSIENIEDEVNQVLKEHKILFDGLDIDKNSVKVLNSSFRRLRELGRIKISFFTPLDEVETMLLHDYILKNYSWVKEISFKKANSIKIKIEEVL